MLSGGETTHASGRQTKANRASSSLRAFERTYPGFILFALRALAAISSSTSRAMSFIPGGCPTHQATMVILLTTGRDAFCGRSAKPITTRGIRLRNGNVLLLCLAQLPADLVPKITQRLPNGNRLICEGDFGRLFVVTGSSSIPILARGRTGQNNRVFRAHRFSKMLRRSSGSPRNEDEA